MERKWWIFKEGRFKPVDVAQIPKQVIRWNSQINRLERAESYTISKYSDNNHSEFVVYRYKGEIYATTFNFTIK